MPLIMLIKLLVIVLVALISAAIEIDECQERVYCCDEFNAPDITIDELSITALEQQAGLNTACKTALNKVSLPGGHIH